MEHYFNQFVNNLHKFLSDLNRYSPSEDIANFLDVFDKLDMGKVILRYLSVIKDYEILLKNRDETLFDKPLKIFPNIDVSLIWIKLSNSRKQKIWTYLQMLYVISELIMHNGSPSSDDNNLDGMISSINNHNYDQSEVSTDTKSESDNKDDKNYKYDKYNKYDEYDKDDKNDKQLEFNPYVGIGQQNENYSVSEMFSGPMELPSDKPAGPGLGSLAGLVGIDKMVNVQELSDQLKNMKKEDIDEATKNIQSMLGANADDKTSDILKDMLTSITDELKNDNISNGNPIDNIVKIAESVASKMKPKIDDNNVDMSQLWSSTQNLATQCKDDNGQNLFDNNAVNPFDLINQMVNNLPNQNQQNMTEEEYLNSCNEMLKNMGINPKI